MYPRWQGKSSSFSSFLGLAPPRWPKTNQLCARKSIEMILAGSLLEKGTSGMTGQSHAVYFALNCWAFLERGVCSLQFVRFNLGANPGVVDKISVATLSLSLSRAFSLPRVQHPCNVNAQRAWNILADSLVINVTNQFLAGVVCFTK